MSDKQPPKKTLGLKLGKRKRVNSDPEEDSRSTRPRTEDPPPSRHRAHSVGDRPSQLPRPSFGKQSSHQDVAVASTSDSGIGTSRFLFPGHNYLGPGNPVNNGEPTNKVDEAARRHDISYSQAERYFEETKDDLEAFLQVQEADDTFLNEVSEIEPSSYTEFFGKVAGQIGIGAKRGIEGLLHSTLYPRFSKDTEMDVVDSPMDTSKVINTSVRNSGVSVMSVGPGVTKSQQTNWHFNKHFHFSFPSSLLQYKKNVSNSNVPFGSTNIKAFIHSIPWEKLYFYLTEREYNTIVNSFHTAYVESVNVKIFNMGVSSPVLQDSSIAFKTLTSNHYIGIYRGFEKHGPVQLGVNITPEVLYGSDLVSLNAHNEFTNVEKDKIGAISESKIVDNRVVYKKNTSYYDKDKRQSVNIAESTITLPPLLDMPVVTVNANNSIGLIYETTYKPRDGLFHNKSYAFHNSAVVQHMPYEYNVNLEGQGSMTAATYVITDKVKNYYPII